MDKKNLDLLESSYKVFLSKKNERTCFIHYCHEENAYEMISLLQNLYYILTLFRMKKTSLFQEGVAILDKVLYFQNENGSFPKYLHELGSTPHHTVLLNQLIILMLIDKFFIKFFSKTLQQRLKKAIDRLYAFVKQYLFKTFSQQFILFCLSSVKNNNKIKKIHFSYIEMTHLCSQGWVDVLIGLTLVEDLIEVDIKQRIYKELLSHFDKRLRLFTSDLHKRYYEKRRIMPTVLDLFFAGFDDLQILGRIEKNHDVWMQACLVFPHDIELNNSSLKHFFYPKIKKETANPTFLTYFWKEEEQLYSLVMESKKRIRMVEQGHRINIYCDDIEELETKDDYFIKIFLPSYESMSFSINDKAKATVFSSKDTVMFFSKQTSIRFKFNHSDQTQILGHIHFGNRFLQKRKDPFIAYDWIIGYRLVKKITKQPSFCLSMDVVYDG